MPVFLIESKLYFVTQYDNLIFHSDFHMLDISFFSEKDEDGEDISGCTIAGSR